MAINDHREASLQGETDPVEGCALYIRATVYRDYSQNLSDVPAGERLRLGRHAFATMREMVAQKMFSAISVGDNMFLAACAAELQLPHASLVSGKPYSESLEAAVSSVLSTKLPSDGDSFTGNKLAWAVEQAAPDILNKLALVTLVSVIFDSVSIKYTRFSMGAGPVRLHYNGNLFAPEPQPFPFAPQGAWTDPNEGYVRPKRPC